MRKNIYLWIFIVVAFFLCGALMIAASNNFKVIDSGGNDYSGSLQNSTKKSNENDQAQMEAAKAVDLTQDNIDFEEDPSDLADDFIDDNSFDDQANLDSIENEIY